VKYVRLYAGSDGESHFEDVEVPMQAMTTVTGVSISEWRSQPIGDAFRFNRVEPNSGDPASAASGEWGPWHPEPRPEFIVWLEGEVEIEIGSGEVRRFGPGKVLLVEDTSGKGHRNRRLSTDMRTIFIPLAAAAPA
jgi:hypothetical protein